MPSFLAPMKLDPWSDLNCRTGPLIAMKNLRALMKQSEVMSAAASITDFKEKEFSNKDGNMKNFHQTFFNVPL